MGPANYAVPQGLRTLSGGVPFGSLLREVGHWRTREASSAAVKEKAMIFAGELRRVLDQDAGTGLIYWSKRRDRTKHQASSPGETPARDTGQLRDGVFTDPTNTQVWQVGVAHPGAAALEYGRRGGTSKMLPRPYFHRSYKAVKDQMEAALKRAIRREMSRGLGI